MMHAPFWKYVRQVTIITAFVLSHLISTTPALAQDEKVEEEQMITGAGNPVTSFINLPVQHNMEFGIGEHDRTRHVIKLQPVRIDFKASRPYKIRSRTVIPLIYHPDISSPNGGTFGLSDIRVAAYFSPDRFGKWIWGLGPILSFPTATAHVLGTGKWSLGPSLVLFTQRKKWLIGIIASNLWSVAGSSSRPDVNLAIIEYRFRYHLGRRWFISSSPLIAANWNAISGNKWLVPVGGGIGRAFFFGPRALSVEVQAFYNVVQPNSSPSPDWSLRFQLTFTGVAKRR
jgi:hypothetical protein